MTSIGNLTGINSIASLEFFDKGSANEILQTLQIEPTVKVATIYDKSKKIFAKYNPNEEKITLPSEPWEDGGYFENGKFILFLPIKLNSERLGTLMLVSDLDPVYERLKYYSLIVTFVILFSLLIAFRHSQSLKKLVAQPIMELASTMKSVSKSADYSIRANKKQTDEIGVLFDQFNSMIDKIQKINIDLKNSNINLERKVDERTKKLIRAQKEAESANHSKSLFLASMSHEIRTPLNGIIGFADLSNLSPNLDEKLRSNLNYILDSGKKLLNFFNNIIDICNLETGSIKVNSEKFSLNELLNEISLKFKSLCDQKKLNWKSDFPKNIPVVSIGDEEKIRKILTNILENSLKYTDSGEISFKVIQEDDYFKFTVQDSSENLSSDHINGIFNPFTQNQSEIGNGEANLGMAIAVKQLELIDGSLNIESSEGIGTIYTIKIKIPKFDKSRLSPVAP